MKKPTIILSFFIVVIVALTVVHAVVANQLSTTGGDLNRLSKQIETYERENALMKEKILQASSFLSISEEAAKRGYTSIPSEIVLTSPLPLAYTR